jgi:magnesium chelatase subunit D
MHPVPAESDRWFDALQAARLLAVDPHGLGGAALHAGHGPVRQTWLAALQAFSPPDTPLRRLPLSTTDDRLLGGLDLSATLSAGRPIVQRGLLAETDGGFLIAAMAERLTEHAAARLCAALDTGEIVLAREGLHDRAQARIGVIALDESVADEDPPPARLLERLAFRLDLDALSPVALQAVLDQAGDDAALATQTLRARTGLPMVQVREAAIEVLCQTALALGIGSLRAPQLALRAARAAAALDGRDQIDADDLSLAARLVLAPRATQWPQAPSEDPTQAAAQDATQDDPQDDSQNDSQDDSQDDGQDASSEAPPAPATASSEDPPTDTDPSDTATDRTEADADAEADPTEIPREMLEAIVLEAARAAIPEGLLQQLQAERAMQQNRTRSAGRSGAAQASPQRGRPLGSRPGWPRHGARLALIDTLRAAAPWQRLRRPSEHPPEPLTGQPSGQRSGQRSGQPSASASTASSRIQIRASDFRVLRLQSRAQTTTVFVVDASGSSALHRLAEAKGAVELLLSECYVRRDQVAVVAFRGRDAEILLPPTRALARARRALSGLPGGGGTPLSRGIERAGQLADGLARQGGTPVVVLLTDGKANVAHDGTGGRARAAADARDAAHRLRLAGHACLLIDTSPRASADAQALAGHMGAAYLPLPQADAQSLSRSVQAASRAVVAGSSRVPRGAA